MEWAKNYQLFLWNNVVIHSIPTNPTRDDATTFRKRFVDKEAMQWWYRVITHSSYDAEDNYVQFSHLGDKMFQATILALDPSKTFSAEFWVAKKTELAISIKLESHLRTVFPFTRNMLVDLVDSLYGCLYLVSEHLYSTGVAFSMCKNLSLAWFKDTIPQQIDHKDTLKYIFESLKWNSGKYYDPKELGKIRGNVDEGYELQHRLTEEAITWFKSRNVELDSDLLGYGKGLTIAETIENANKATVDILKRYGVDIKYIEDENRIDSYLASERMKDDGFITLEIVNGGNIYQLIGIKGNGKKVIILSVLSKDHLITNNQILELYITFGIQSVGTIITI